MKRILELNYVGARPPIEAACLTSRHLVCAHGEHLAVFSVAGKTTNLEESIALPQRADRVRISPSGRWLLVRRAPGDQLDVIDRKDPEAAQMLSAKQHGQRIVMEFAEVGGRELAVIVTRSGHYEVFELGTSNPPVTFDCFTFGFSSLSFVGDGSHVLALGYYEGEGNDSLAAIDLRYPPADVAKQMRVRSGIMDYTYRLCAGPCGRDAFVAFRDPAGEEDEDSFYEDGRSDIWSLGGAYVRRLDGTLLQQIVLEPHWKSFSPAAGGPSTLAVAVDDGIYLVDRQSETTTTVPGRWLAASPDGAHVLVEQDSELAILDL